MAASLGLKAPPPLQQPGGLRAPLDPKQMPNATNNFLTDGRGHALPAGTRNNALSRSAARSTLSCTSLVTNLITLSRHTPWTSAKEHKMNTAMNDDAQSLFQLQCHDSRAARTQQAATKATTHISKTLDPSLPGGQSHPHPSGSRRQAQRSHPQNTTIPQTPLVSDPGSMVCPRQRLYWEVQPPRQLPVRPS